MELIKKLMEQRAAMQATLDGILEAAEKEQRSSLTEEELASFNDTDAKLKELDARIDQLNDVEKRRQAAEAVIASNGPVVRVRSEPLTYRRGNGNSYFFDLARAHAFRDQEAAERLTRHAREMDVELPERAQRREEIAEREMRSLGEGTAFERRVNPNRTDGQGGFDLVAAA